MPSAERTIFGTAPGSGDGFQHHLDTCAVLNPSFYRRESFVQSLPDMKHIRVPWDACIQRLSALNFYVLIER